MPAAEAVRCNFKATTSAAAASAPADRLNLFRMSNGDILQLNFSRSIARVCLFGVFAISRARAASPAIWNCACAARGRLVPVALLLVAGAR